MNKLTITQNSRADMRDFYGIFFEDINHAADGGLYAEKIRNRAFEFSPTDNPSYNSLTAWQVIDEGRAGCVSASVSDKNPFSKQNPHYLVLEVMSPATRAGIRNLGYSGGISVTEGETYIFSCRARSKKECPITISIDDAYGNPIVKKKFTISSSEWTKYTFPLTVTKTETSASLAVTAHKRCKFCLDFVSLFPKDTYKGRENGMRKDIAEMLAALKPRFMRFPGGCLVHDGSLNPNDRNSMYRWKNTIGDITERPPRRNNWNYNQSLGIGYYEYFLFCEDIGAKPLPVLPAGYNPHSSQAAPLTEMDDWINDALDLIEFANGAPDTKWGKIRTDLGHRASFNLEYLAIGNEEVGKGFWDRYDLFHEKIKEKYPEIKLINSAGPFPGGTEFRRGHKNAEKNGSDLIDEHYYTSPEWMIANYNRYDKYSADAPKVFLGEYASWGNEYKNALFEAAYMTGLENNAHAVSLACYAPLLANADYVNWKPDMIWFDNSRVYGSANYYVQKLFMNNTGDELLEIKKEGLKKKLPLTDGIIKGGIEIESDCRAVISDITVTENGEVHSFEDISLTPEEGVSLCEASEEAEIEFTLRRLSGESGIRLIFGKTDEKNYRQWMIGGWQNKDSEIASIIDDRNSSLDHRVFSLGSGRDYRVRLKISGRKVDAYIDDKKMNAAEDKPAVMEELYVTASRGEEYIYIKAVNTTDASVKATVCAEGIKKAAGEVFTLSGYEMTDKNSFEEPEKIFPEAAEIKYKTNSFSYIFPPQSVTIFKLRRI